ncbi:hypothetical protein GGG16DRAFT_117259 [Schizophyllum commune]
MSPADSPGPTLRASVPVGSRREVAMIAGSSGITPLHQILEYALKNKENRTHFTLIFADAVYTLDKLSEGWKGPTGYHVRVLVCGPPGQVAALAGKKASYAQGELLGVLKGLNYMLNYMLKQVFKL